MINRTFLADWRHLAIPLSLSIAVVGAALTYALTAF